MAQHDYVIANGTGAAVRSDLNDAFAAIVSQNSGTTEPATTYAYQFWADTSAGVLKLRNAANNAWITLRELDGTLTMEDGAVSAPGLAFASDLNTGIFTGGADQFNIATNGVERVEFGTSEVVFNDGGANYDFRIEGDTEANLFFVDASTDRVGLGTSSPRGIIDAIGTCYLGSTTSGSRSLFVNEDANGAMQVVSDSTSFGLALESAYSTGYIKFRIAGTDKMHLDSSGRLGIGTSPGNTLHLAGGNGVGVRIQNTDNSISAYSTLESTGALQANISGTGFFSWVTGGGEKVRIDSSGRLLVGTSSSANAAASCRVITNANSTELRLNNEGSDPNVEIIRTVALGGGGGIGSIYFKAYDSGTTERVGASLAAITDGNWASGDCPTRLMFSTTAGGASTPTERMRITSSADTEIRIVGRNATDTGGFAFVNSSQTRYWGIATNSTNLYIHDDDFSNYAYLTQNPTAWQFASDKRLKENIEDLDYGIDALKQIKARRFSFVGDTVTNIGFIAQELKEIIPEAVSGDEIPYEDTDTPQEKASKSMGVGKDNLIPVLVKALQEAIEKIETLEAEVAALKAP